MAQFARDAQKLPMSARRHRTHADASGHRGFSGQNVITLTRLNGARFVVNCELIRTIEERPDTTIVLTSGDTLIVKERMEEVVARAVEYGRMVRMFHP